MVENRNSVSYFQGKRASMRATQDAKKRSFNCAPQSVVSNGAEICSTVADAITTILRYKKILCQASFRSSRKTLRCPAWNSSGCRWSKNLQKDVFSTFDSPSNFLFEFPFFFFYFSCHQEFPVGQRWKMKLRCPSIYSTILFVFRQTPSLLDLRFSVNWNSTACRDRSFQMGIETLDMIITDYNREM